MCRHKPVQTHAYWQAYQPRPQPVTQAAWHVRNNLLSMVARNPDAGHLPLGRHKAPGWPPDEHNLTYEEVMVARKGDWWQGSVTKLKDKNKS